MASFTIIDLLLSDRLNRSFSVSLPKSLYSALDVSVDLHNAQLDDPEDHISKSDVVEIALRQYLIKTLFGAPEEQTERPIYPQLRSSSTTGRRQLRS